jgi:4-alpha-glucanotransferase
MSQRDGLPNWLSKRSSGVLLHPSSLPSNYGIGSFGQSAKDWIDFLSDAGFSYWQMCPLGPTGFGDSPYQVFSSSAGSPYFIDWEPLISSGYIIREELLSLSSLSAVKVEYGILYEAFFPIMRKAFFRYQNDPSPMDEKYGSLDKFLDEHFEWLDPFARYQSLKKRNGLKPWWKWSEKDRDFPGGTLHQDCSTEYHFQVFLQFLFRSQWDELHHYAQSLNISLIGDLPIYVAPDSADTWANRPFFQIDSVGNFEAVAGVPPDYFNSSGQLWGNPLYNWKKLADDGYKWWINRIRDQLALFEVVRIDHFRAFHDFWSIPAESLDATKGKWLSGPGLKFWNTLADNFPELPFLAEDLGDISKDVRNLRTNMGLPGMAVLQFAFDGNPQNLYLPHNLSKDLVLYTGTHDNDTSCGWYNSTDEGTRSFFRNYLNIDGSSPGWDMLRNAYRTVSNLVVIPAQDLLSLGSEARFNTPGELGENWQWRMTSEQFTQLRHNSSHYLREQALLAGRLNEKIDLEVNEP